MVIMVRHVDKMRKQEIYSEIWSRNHLGDYRKRDQIGE
jgi:hypothetical protein